MGYKLVGTVQDRPVRLDVTESDLTIGRASSCAVQVPNPSVSREHARLALREGRVTIDDLESRNGTWVNGNRIAGQTTLSRGDRIEIGGVVFELQSDEPSPRTIFAHDADMGTTAALAWKEIYGPAPGAPALAADKKLTLFQVLAEAGELLADQRPLHELFEVILDLVDKGVSSDRTALLLLGEPHEEPTVTASRSRHGGPNEQIMLSRTMVDRVVRERTSLLTADAIQDPRFEKQESIILQGTRSAMAAPLFDNANVVGVLYVDTTDPALRYSTDELRTFTILANLIGVKITQSRLAEVREANRRHEAELQTAKSILNKILPDALVDIPGYELAELHEPSLTVGGDLYDTRWTHDGSATVMMGDVTGKGLGAALLVSNIMASLRLLTDERFDGVSLVTRLNRQVFRSTDPLHYATFFFGVLSPETGRLDYVNAGHNPPLLVAPTGAVTEIGATGTPVGMFEDTEYFAGETMLEPGGLLLLYSDGVPEAEAANEEEYGMDRLIEVLREARGQPAAEVVDSVRRSLRRFIGETPPSDDITMLLVRRLPKSEKA